MLDTDTKRRIDSARDILVGKAPDPKSQVEQITVALSISSWMTWTPRRRGGRDAGDPGYPVYPVHRCWFPVPVLAVATP
jgi:hypothetical protein